MIGMHSRLDQAISHRSHSTTALLVYRQITRLGETINHRSHLLTAQAETTGAITMMPSYYLGGKRVLYYHTTLESWDAQCGSQLYSTTIKAHNHTTVWSIAIRSIGSSYRPQNKQPAFPGPHQNNNYRCPWSASINSHYYDRWLTIGNTATMLSIPV